MIPSEATLFLNLRHTLDAVFTELGAMVGHQFHCLHAVLFLGQGVYRDTPTHGHREEVRKKESKRKDT